MPSRQRLGAASVPSGDSRRRFTGIRFLLGEPGSDSFWAELVIRVVVRRCCGPVRRPRTAVGGVPVPASGDAARRVRRRSQRQSDVTTTLLTCRARCCHTPGRGELKVDGKTNNLKKGSGKHIPISFREIPRVDKPPGNSIYLGLRRPWSRRWPPRLHGPGPGGGRQNWKLIVVKKASC